MADKRLNMVITANAAQAERALSGLNKSIAGLGAALVGGLSFGKLVTDFVEVNKQFQSLKASLVTVTGSAANADAAFAGLQEFAAKTPYQLNEVVSAFIKMRSLGLQPTEETLTSFGNTAAAMGKSLNQFVEAVADAVTGEFERLKEFGIKSKQEGDRVSFTFQGVTTTVGKNAEEIQKYLEGIGNVQFAGAMEKQMGTLGGALSNLADAYESLLYKAGESEGANRQLGAAIGDLSKIISSPATLTALTNFATGIAIITAKAASLSVELEKSVGTTARWVAAWTMGDISTGEFLGTLGKELIGIDRGAGFRRLEQIELGRDLQSGQLALDTANMPPSPFSKALSASGKRVAVKTSTGAKEEKFAGEPFEASGVDAAAYSLLGAGVEAPSKLSVMGNEAASSFSLMGMELSKMAVDGEASVADLMVTFDDFSTDVSETSKTIVDDMKEGITGWASQFSASLNEALWAADASFSSIAESFAKMITQILIQRAIVQPIVGGMMSLFPSANGNAFSGGNLAPFANGGVVYRPTVFPMATGMGLMGEAGPEAVMPLKRLGNGKLGVMAQGGGTPDMTVNVINQTGQQVKTSSRPATFDGKGYVKTVILELMDTDPMFQRGMRGY